MKKSWIQIAFENEAGIEEPDPCFDGDEFENPLIPEF